MPLLYRHTFIPYAFTALAYFTVHAESDNYVTHTHPFNGPLSGTTRVSRYQKGKTSLDFFAEARDSEWQWHQLDHNYASLHLAPDR